MKLATLVAYLDDYFNVKQTQDYSDNGLQVAGSEQVDRLAFAVDACQETIDAAVANEASMLIVHHGLFWGQVLPIVGPHRRRIKTLLDAGCSLYAVHLPLDRHPQVGNNVQLAHLLGLDVVGEFGEAFGVPIGVIAQPPSAIPLSALVEQLSALLGNPPLLLAGGPSSAHRIGIISGSAASDIPASVAAGCDTFITGETRHSAYHDAQEHGINVLYAGHYASETVGLKALASHLETHWKLPCTFIDRPTGL